MTVTEGDPFGEVKSLSQPGGTVPAELVNRFHSKSDKDSGTLALHHTLGPDASQASPGDHKHNGRDSKKILDGVSINGDYSLGTVLPSVVSALVGLGATDNTVP